MTAIKARHLSIIIAIVMMFTGAYIMMGQDADAVSKPKAPNKIYAKNIKYTTATISWTRVSRNVKGYTIFRNGKAIKSVGKNVTKYNEKAIKAGHKYHYKVRAFNTVKKKQWYNKKTKKWQANKPAYKYRGKSRYVRAKVYGGTSATVSFTTYNDTWKIYGRTVKASQCPFTFKVQSSQCPKCGVYGEKATVYFKNNKWSERCVGTDYSKECHHCEGIVLKGWCIRYDGNGNVIRTLNFTDEGLLIVKDGTVNTTQKYNGHEFENEGCHDLIEGAKDNVRHINAQNKWVYCQSCSKRCLKPTDVPSGWTFR